MTAEDEGLWIVRSVVGVSREGLKSRDFYFYSDNPLCENEFNVKSWFTKMVDSRKGPLLDLYLDGSL